MEVGMARVFVNPTGIWIRLFFDNQSTILEICVKSNCPDVYICFFLCPLLLINRFLFLKIFYLAISFLDLTCNLQGYYE